MRGDPMLKYQNLAGVGDRIRAYDFRGGKDYYIEGVVVAKGAIRSPQGGYMLYEGYTISIDVDTLGGREGDAGYVPFETTLDYDERIELVETVGQRVDSACAA
jgi:hypothetical protein